MYASVCGFGAGDIFKDFYMLTNQSLWGCEYYDLMEFQRQEGLFLVFYLELAMRKLNYDYCERRRRGMLARGCGL